MSILFRLFPRRTSGTLYVLLYRCREQKNLKNAKSLEIANLARHQFIVRGHNTRPRRKQRTLSLGSLNNYRVNNIIIIIAIYFNSV